VTATRVVVTTVGPYIRYGEPLVAACTAAGTDYVDLAGEPEFVDLTYVRHHARAEETGARIVHCCGFDAIPSDLGAYYTVTQLPEHVPIRVRGFVRAKGIPSGGTLHSAIIALSRNRETANASAARRQVEPRETDRRARGIKSMLRYEQAVGAWALPLPAIDPQIVLRSAHALQRYGPDFSYGHYARVKRLPVALGIAGGVAALVGLAQFPTTRSWLLARKRPGEGPTTEQREKNWFTTRFIGEGGGRRVITEVAGGDPGYGATSKMLAESALCLAQDDLPVTAGQVTTAVAMGDALIERLKRAGIGFTVLEST
jgi:saccharopine dehydrogenase (NAD+, L-glutamate forming)